MAMVLPSRTAWTADILSQASLRDVERQRCWKRGIAETGRDFGTTLRHDWAIFTSMPLTSEVRRSPEPSARPSAAADSEERQICTTCLFAESVGLCWCFLPSCAMYKDNALANVVAEMGRDVVSTTARLSDLSMPLKGEVRRSPEQSARQPIARSGKFVRRARGERWIVLMLSPIVRDVQRQRCSKRGSGDGQRLSLYDYGTTERSFHAVERWGSTLTCTVCTAADSEERQICTTCLFAESVGLWKRRRSYLYVCFLMYAFSHRDRGAHFCLRGGWGKRGDLTWHPAVKHQRPAAKTTNSNCCDLAAVQVK